MREERRKRGERAVEGSARKDDFEERGGERRNRVVKADEWAGRRITSGVAKVTLVGVRDV